MILQTFDFAVAGVVVALVILITHYMKGRNQ